MLQIVVSEFKFLLSLVHLCDFIVKLFDWNTNFGLDIGVLFDWIARIEKIYNVVDAVLRLSWL